MVGQKVLTEHFWEIQLKIANVNNTLPYLHADGVFILYTVLVVLFGLYADADLYIHKEVIDEAILRTEGQIPDSLSELFEHVRTFVMFITS